MADASKFKCDLCGRSFTTKNKLCYHVEHGVCQKPDMTCTKCGKTFTRRTRFNEHRLKCSHVVDVTETFDCEGEESDEVETIVVFQSDLSIENAFKLDVEDKHFVLDGHKIRKTNEAPTRLSVYDLITAITGQDAKQCFHIYTRLSQSCPAVQMHCLNCQFPGERQRPTPVTDARGMVMIINLLPGHRAAQFRLSTAEILVRYLGGDKTLIAEINGNADFQANASKDNIASIFGDAVAESSQAIVIASRTPPVTLNSVTGFIDMRGPQNYFRLTDSSLWSNVHPCGRPDLIMESEELAKHAVVKIGCNGESTGRQPAHELSLKGSKLLDSIPTKCYTYVEQRAKDVWKNNNELFEGTHWGKTTRDTELLLFKTQAQYSQAVELVKDLVEEAESSGDLQLQLEREKTKQAESAAKQAESAAKQADSAARIAEAEVRKLELQIELARMRAPITPHK